MQLLVVGVDVRGRFDEVKLHKGFNIKRSCSVCIYCAHLVTHLEWAFSYVHLLFIHQRRCYLDAFRNFHFQSVFVFCFPVFHLVQFFVSIMLYFVNAKIKETHLSASFCCKTRSKRN